MFVVIEALTEGKPADIEIGEFAVKRLSLRKSLRTSNIMSYHAPNCNMMARLWS
jgi:hypothetical protein